MLHIKTVEPDTLSLLKELLSTPCLSEFYLVGGTALSLQLGHRISVDLDLFCSKEFDKSNLIENLHRMFGQRFSAEKNAIGIFAFIDKIKVDLVEFQYERIAEPIIIEDIRMYSLEDIAAMKINAILRRASKKDFWDLAEILSVMPIKDIIACYKKKFSDQHLLLSIPSALTYFVEADENQFDPISLKGQTWESVKSKIGEAANEYLK